MCETFRVGNYGVVFRYPLNLACRLFYASQPMCPSISCCHRRLTQPLPTHLYYLGRLVLTQNSDELLADQHVPVPERLKKLRDQVQ